MKGTDNNEKRQKFLKRIYQETKDQGGVLPEADGAVIMRLSYSVIHRQIVGYEKRTGEIIPRCGNVMDIGRTLTHKKLAFHNFKKKMSTTENARSIDHSPESVDRYIRDGTRVEKLYDSGYSPWDIAYLTGLSISVVNQYIKVIDEFHLKSDSKGGKDIADESSGEEE